MEVTAVGTRGVVLGAALVLAQTMAAHAQKPTGATDGQWPHYGGDKGSTKYAALDQIKGSNVNDLEEAWRWASVDARVETTGAGDFKATPIVVDGVMYTSTREVSIACCSTSTRAGIALCRNFLTQAGTFNTWGTQR